MKKNKHSFLFFLTEKKILTHLTCVLFLFDHSIKTTQSMRRKLLQIKWKPYKRIGHSVSQSDTINKQNTRNNE